MSPVNRPQQNDHWDLLPCRLIRIDRLLVLQLGRGQEIQEGLSDPPSRSGRLTVSVSPRGLQVPLAAHQQHLDPRRVNRGNDSWTRGMGELMRLQKPPRSTDLLIMKRRSVHLQPFIGATRASINARSR